MATTRKSKQEKAEDQLRIEREINQERDMRDMALRMGNIETSIRNIEAKNHIIASLEFKVSANDKRITDLENAKAGVIKLVMGTVGIAVLALVVGKVIP